MAKIIWSGDFEQSRMKKKENATLLVRCVALASYGSMKFFLDIYSMDRMDQIEFLKDRVQELSVQIEKLSAEVSILTMSLSGSKRYNQFLVDQLIRMGKVRTESKLKHLKHWEGPWIEPDKLNDDDDSAM